MSTTTEQGLGWDWQKLTAEARRVYEPICHQCRQVIDETLPRTHRLSYTVHHLDARDTYGTDLPTIDRVRPSHRSCNSRQGTRADPPPRRWVL